MYKEWEEELLRGIKTKWKKTNDYTYPHELPINIKNAKNDNFDKE